MRAGKLNGARSRERRSASDARRYGPYHGSSQRQRLPKRPTASVRPTHQTVQNMSGSGFESGSRLPAKPADSSAQNTTNDARLVTTRPSKVRRASSIRMRASLSSGAGGTATSTRKLAATAAAPPAI